MQPQITGTRYVLPLRTCRRQPEFYTTKLDFIAIWKDDGCFLQRDELKIMIGECPDDAWPTDNTVRCGLVQELYSWTYTISVFD